MWRLTWHLGTCDAILSVPRVIEVKIRKFWTEKWT